MILMYSTEMDEIECDGLDNDCSDETPDEQDIDEDTILVL